MYPPYYPQPYDCKRPCDWKHPCRPPRPDLDCPWDLTPAGMNATVLGIDCTGGVIIRLTRCDPAPNPRPCDQRPRPCR